MPEIGQALPGALLGLHRDVPDHVEPQVKGHGGQDIGHPGRFLVRQIGSFHRGQALDLGNHALGRHVLLDDVWVEHKPLSEIHSSMALQDVRLPGTRDAAGHHRAPAHQDLGFLPEQGTNDLCMLLGTLGHVDRAVAIFRVQLVS